MKNTYLVGEKPAKGKKRPKNWSQDRELSILHRLIVSNKIQNNVGGGRTTQKIA